ncbi:RsmB/NOP family class I SAM-dependent RNA methyltransferase [Granulicoccus phenolivorans]|uniref:RsmB/NOP family class I SAM-dependent RNA methyltransferase n=1 Tax=Granulicoccus phenolivorans TaxID=266854 RepID=UPI000426C8AF|nr:RsmB/NOP family class I SAM-dependent RNA methyltransferase [Granulicoccus phenolivorans]
MSPAARRPAPRRRPKRRIDAPRRAAYDALRQVTGNDAYANLVGPELLGQRHITGRDAAFATELLNGTCRLQGTYDLIIAAASGRKLGDLQANVLDVLRLGCHQLLSMRVPTHAAVAASVDLAAVAIGERVTGLVNAILRRVGEHSMDEWLDRLTAGLDEALARAIRSHHPRWIVDEYARLLPADELDAALAANNIAPRTCLAIRPGLSTVAELVDAGAEAHPRVPTAAYWPGNPGDLAAVRDGRAGVQDPGSQLAALAVVEPDAPEGPWLDLCAGPGGKSALLAGLAREQGTWLLASELQPHRAALVAQALRAYPEPHRPQVIAADGTRPAVAPGSFARVLADVPCTGLGALRRRPESRWRRTPQDLAALVPLQRALLRAALDAAAPGGVVAYVTCSPVAAETTEVVEHVLAERPEVTRIAPDHQLWPHRDGTDAMFRALLRVPADPAGQEPNRRR